MSENFYSECILHKGTEKQTAWIPSKFASPLTLLGIRKFSVKPKDWDWGWAVMMVGLKEDKKNLDPRKQVIMEATRHG